MKESDIQTLLSKWLKENKDMFDTSIAVELKLCKGKAIPFSAIPDHQLKSLIEVVHKGFYYKIFDAPFGRSNFRFHQKRPFDCFLIKGEAFVGICFYIPKKRKSLYLIPIIRFMNMKAHATRKSITEDMCREYANRKIEL